MTLTDEEAREIVDILRRMTEWMSDCGHSRLLREDAKPCIALLESRIGEAEKDRDALSARVRELEADLAVMAHAYRHDTRPPDDVVQRAARALKGEA